jgi:hypothetical protein
LIEGRLGHALDSGCDGLEIGYGSRLHSKRFPFRLELGPRRKNTGVS